VALARAVVIEPAILLMDEPLGALDRQLRKEVQLEIRRMHVALPRTTLYVTHDQEEALVMSDRIAVMRSGRIVQIGSGRDLYERPSTPSWRGSWVSRTSSPAPSGILRAGARPWRCRGLRS
jgi:ABC-type Fe3+/spermidine/putrescine transport system ATPase subunit